MVLNLTETVRAGIEYLHHLLLVAYPDLFNSPEARHLMQTFSPSFIS
jgi:hypothetical protein